LGIITQPYFFLGGWRLGKVCAISSNSKNQKENKHLADENNRLGIKDCNYYC
jgi:hypothetical protein